MTILAAILSESEAMTFTRHAAGTRDATSGLYVPGSTSTLSAQVSLQPLSMREVQLLPEGIRQKAAWKLYTGTALQIADPTANALADQFTKNGKVYEITSLGEWDTHGDYNKYVAFKVEQ